MPRQSLCRSVSREYRKTCAFCLPWFSHTDSKKGAQRQRLDPVAEWQNYEDREGLWYLDRNRSLLAWTGWPRARNFTHIALPVRTIRNVYRCWSELRLLFRVRRAVESEAPGN